jgi:uncharacterized protein YajQ (UPF0234 family)
MASLIQQIEKLQREIEKLLADSETRLEKEHNLFLQKLAKIDVKIAALADEPPRKPRKKRQRTSAQQLALIE